MLSILTLTISPILFLSPKNITELLNLFLPNNFGWFLILFSTKTLTNFPSNDLFLFTWLINKYFWISFNLALDISLSINFNSAALVPGLGLNINE